MNPILKNIVAVLTGVIAGSAVNMGIVMISSSIIPPPEGVDNTTMEGLKAGIHLFQPKHFLFPFLAHAIGTFAGALLAAIISVKRKMLFAFVVGVFFLAGGIANIIMLPSPMWFTIVDLVAAYIPMAFLGGKLVIRNTNN
jgi:hypothetical protein